MANQSKATADAQRATACWAVASQLFGEGKWAAAAAALLQALEFDPENAAIWSDLGAAEQYRGDLASAGTAYERSLALQPNNLQTLANFGFLLVQQGQPQRAIERLRPMLDSSTASALMWTAAGHAHRALGDVSSAVAAFRNSTALAPADLEARHNLAIALRAASIFSESEAVTRELLAADQNHAEAWHTLGNIMQSQGRIDEAIDAFRRNVDLQPGADKHSSLLLAMQYAEDVEPATLLAAHHEWGTAYTRSLSPFPPRPIHRDPNRKLHIGFVSSQFGRHPIGFLALRAIECLDKTGCSIACYSGRSTEDEYTARFRAASDIWRTTVPLSAEQLAAQIRADEIDILIDLMGHTSPALLAFAYRPAPLQVSWLGYVGTTGLSAMDCLVADSYHVRPGEEAAYTEQVLRMPNGYACYGPPINTPDVSELPALNTGRITFGCVNNPAKFSPGIVQTWAEILKRVPNSRLLLKFFGLDDGEVQRRLLDRFAAAGADPARVLLEGEADHQAMLASYQRVDLALDTQPYSGGLTTCESLWMGVPVITFPGKTFAGRHSTSHLTNAGYGQFVASERAGYVDLAVTWANRLDELAAIRSQMREQVGRSPLCDAQKFANDFLAALHDAWQTRFPVSS